MQFNTSHHPTTFQGSARMSRAVDMGRQISMHLLKNLKPTTTDHYSIEDWLQEEEEEEVLTWRKRLVSGPKFEKMGIATVVGTYEPYPTKFPLHLGQFVLIHTIIWWASNLYGDSP